MRMKRLVALSVLLAAVLGGGCQTHITATKNPEVILPKYSADGTKVTGYMVASGGWTASARSPLWATESLRGLDIGVETNGSVHLILGEYQRDLSTNAVEMTKILTDGAVNLASKVCAAIVSSGASPAADGVSALVQKFIASGGDATKATVTCADGKCSVTDGCVTCDDSGCSACGGK